MAKEETRTQIMFAKPGSAVKQTQQETAVLLARIAELEAENAVLKEQVIHDPLTGLYNRRCLESQMRREFGRMRRGDIGAVSILFIDLDNFKAVNTDHGHVGGDAVLVNVAQTMLANMRPGDILIRLGGDEFMAILPDANKRGAFHFAERLRQIIARQPARLANGALVHATVSIGVASHQRGDEDDFAAFLDRADRGMHAAKKRSGKNSTTAIGH